MTTFNVKTIINSPSEIITGALMNPDNFPYWTTDLEKFEVISGKSGEVGSVGRLHFNQKGKKYIMEDKLIYCIPEKKYISEVTGTVISARVETTLLSSGNTTEMSIIWSGKGKSLILKLLLPFVRNKMIKQSKSELEKFKNLVETKGVDFK